MCQACARHSSGTPVPVEMIGKTFFNRPLEQDHRFIKPRIRPMLGFSLIVAATLMMAGSEFANMISEC